MVSPIALFSLLIHLYSIDMETKNFKANPDGFRLQMKSRLFFNRGWVTCPFWGILAIAIVIFIISMIIGGLIDWDNDPPKQEKRKCQQRLDEMQKQKNKDNE